MADKKKWLIDQIFTEKFKPESDSSIRPKSVDIKDKKLGLSSSGRLTIPKERWARIVKEWAKEGEEVFYSLRFNDEDKALAAIFYTIDNRPFKCRKVQRYAGRDTKPTTAYLELAYPLGNWGYKIKHDRLTYVDYVFDEDKKVLLLDLKNHLKRN